MDDSRVYSVSINMSSPSDNNNNQAYMQDTNTRVGYRSPEEAFASPRQRTTPTTEGRRGRPRSEVLTDLMQKGSESPSAIKCNICNRVFPRDKSLQAHCRTHTGEKPFVCSYPNCTKSFAQSGQLNTHNRLHTGEKPFQCSAEGCNTRFAHSNRHCNDHPTDAVRRNPDENYMPTFIGEPVSEEVLNWHENYRKQRDGRTPKSSGKKNTASVTPRTPVTLLINSPPVRVNKSKRVLGPLLDQSPKRVVGPLWNQSQRFNRPEPYSPARPALTTYSYSPSPDIRVAFVDENTNHRLLSPPTLPTRVPMRQPVSILLPARSEYSFEMDGIRPLDADEYVSPYDYQSTKSPSLNRNNSYFPDQLCSGDVTPMKNSAHKANHSGNSIPVENSYEIIPAEVLALPKAQYYRSPQQASCSSSLQSSELTSPSANVRPSGKLKPKQMWIHSSLKNAATKQTTDENPHIKHIPPKGGQNKDAMLGAMALVELGTPNEDPMQPLDLSTRE